jgi:hypothetical protein
MILEHSGGKSAISLQLPHKRQKYTFFRLLELNDSTACCRAYIGRQICSLKLDFSFLNGNLMVPTGHRIIFWRVVTTLREPGSMTLESLECGGR